MKSARVVAPKPTAKPASDVDPAVQDRSPPGVLDPTLRRLAGFASLEPDWDADGALPIAAVAIETAERFVTAAVATYAPTVGEERAMPSWVSPLPNGGVQIDWHSPAAELEVDIDPRGAIGYLLQRGKGDQATFDEADAVAPADVLQLLDSVLRS